MRTLFFSTHDEIEVVLPPSSPRNPMRTATRQTSGTRPFSHRDTRVHAEFRVAQDRQTGCGEGSVCPSQEPFFLAPHSRTLVYFQKIRAPVAHRDALALLQCQRTAMPFRQRPLSEIHLRVLRQVAGVSCGSLGSFFRTFYLKLPMPAHRCTDAPTRR